MVEHLIQGFPRMGQPISMPNIAEILVQSMYRYVMADDLYKNGGEFYRHLIEHTPLLNDKKYVSIQSTVELLYPSPRTANFDWHWVCTRRIGRA